VIELIKIRGKSPNLWIIVPLLLFMLITGCKARDKIFTIGIASHASSQAQELKGFKKGMAELGYVEGENVKYIYFSRALGNNDQIIDSELKKLLAQNIDLLFTAYNERALRAKKAVEGTDIPVIAAVCSRPVEIGLVKSLSHPEGNVTGVQAADTISKGLEWLMQIFPHAKNIYLPYNPDDMISTLYLDSLNKAASQLGIKLIFNKIYSVEEAVASIENIPKDVDAIYGIPSQTIGSKSSELSHAAINRGLPLGAGLSFDDALIALGVDYFEIGKQAAQLAHKIHQGIKPVDLPFETSEVKLVINLKTAEKIGFTVPDNILSQATIIIR
jgi:putative tryptophan/tyrosine transport system substrate-binding protein